MRGSQLTPKPHHVLGGTQRPSLRPGCVQHPASQLVACSVKELIRTPEHFSAQIQLRAYAKCEPLVAEGEKSEATCYGKSGRRRAA